MVNRWIEHVKTFAKKNNTTYGCALSNPRISDGYVSSLKSIGKKSVPLTMNEIVALRKITNKQAKTGSAIIKREARDIINSQTEKGSFKIDKARDAINDAMIMPQSKLFKKKSGVLI